MQQRRGRVRRAQRRGGSPRSAEESLDGLLTVAESKCYGWNMPFFFNAWYVYGMWKQPATEDRGKVKAAGVATRLRALCWLDSIYLTMLRTEVVRSYQSGSTR